MNKYLEDLEKAADDKKDFYHDDIATDNPVAILNEKQKSAMINFCTAYAGELKYIPTFNTDSICTINAMAGRKS